MGDISNNLQPLCYCPERDLILGRRAYVCQVCSDYTQTNRKIPDVYEESRKEAEKKIKEKKLELEAFELAELAGEEEIDLTIDEFEEEEDEEVPLKFEKRKAGKEEMGAAEDFSDVECPFCGEISDDLRTHIQTCEFAPDDVSIEDILPSKGRKKKKSATTSSAKGKGKQKCPYCGKEFSRLGRHLSSCSKRPKDEDADDDEEEEEDEDGDDDDDEEEEEDEDDDDDFD